MAKGVRRIIVRGKRRQPDIERLARTLLRQVQAQQRAARQVQAPEPSAPPPAEAAS
jgi:hypothetical protein